MEFNGQFGDYATVGNIEKLIEKTDNRKCPQICQVGKRRRRKSITVGMAEKVKEFTATGSEIYHGKPEGVDDHH